MEKEGTRFRPGVDVGHELTGSDLRKKYDAVVLAVGATQWRDLPIKGREYKGIYQAMEFLPWGNKQALGEIENPDINVAGKHVVILGGGDTGADCLGTSIRQGAASITQLEISGHEDCVHLISPPTLGYVHKSKQAFFRKHAQVNLKRIENSLITGSVRIELLANLLAFLRKWVS